MHCQSREVVMHVPATQHVSTSRREAELELEKRFEYADNFEIRKTCVFLCPGRGVSVETGAWQAQKGCQGRVARLTCGAMRGWPGLGQEGHGGGGCCPGCQKGRWKGHGCACIVRVLMSPLTLLAPVFPSVPEHPQSLPQSIQCPLTYHSDAQPLLVSYLPTTSPSVPTSPAVSLSVLQCPFTSPSLRSPHRRQPPPATHPDSL
ncbi:hypothetical protein E2C01_011436 [Portunus trituberculatus]|uniref:Uncharacterized protein n=1 Tax=Portunus trituberculatus TaxID=210409 RepID=A0A5B7DB09_PORTR|nr:hypothetical protein [Portunus trituberculatus]